MKIKKTGPDRLCRSTKNLPIGIRKIIKFYEIYSLQIFIIDDVDFFVQRLIIYLIQNINSNI
jgi:hypothetical protein